MYFANDESVASVYGTVKTFKINTDSSFITDRTRPKRDVIEILIRNSPDLEDALTNWDENPKVALRKAVNANCDVDQMVKSLLFLQNDFYRNADEEFMKNCVELCNLNGMILNVAESKFLILYNFKKAKLIG